MRLERNQTLRISCAIGFCTLILCGCRTRVSVTDTAQTGTQQLLLSSTADSVIRSMDYSPLAWRKVFLDTSKLTDDLNGYLVYRIREEMTLCNAHVVDTKDKADLIIEIGVAAHGTNSMTNTLGVVNGSNLPDVNLSVTDTQYAVTQISMVGYDRETGSAVWHSGPLRADAFLRQKTVLGHGPYFSGTIEHPHNRLTRSFPNWFSKKEK